ncbi:hypothetical protein [Gracilibacillus thailandensis]|uniref:DUF4328 domain-containing protein n=2 Tax=Gracilibacillus thailandensis TaxID=563735 RepID=A0A6N7R488_9BACI|nr:hypothetical protein [Gracilibacillus thailandensis]MRI68016.1 hypothetical protein [Gracilibacillus thailandensis]
MMELSSKATGNMLKGLLTIGVVLSTTLVFTTFFDIYYYDLYQSFISEIDLVISMIYLVLWLITVVFYLVWIHKVHQDLKMFHSQYPITPGGALARILIPFYNIYGLWNVFSTMRNYFKEYSSTLKFAQIMTTLIPFYYILHWATNVLNQLVSRNQIINNHVIFSSYVLDTVLVVIYLFMTKYILESLQSISKEISSDNKSQTEATTEIK